MSLDVDLVKKVSCFSKNITHNLGDMAEAAGVYEACWRPEELNITQAGHLVPILKLGLHRLKKNPEKYKKLNPKNGWGTYEILVKFVEEYLDACEMNPNAYIEVSR